MTDALNDVSSSWKNRYRKWILNHAGLHEFKSLFLQKRDAQVPVHACNQFSETLWYAHQAHRLVYTHCNLWKIESIFQLSLKWINFSISTFSFLLFHMLWNIMYHVTIQQVAVSFSRNMHKSKWQTSPCCQASSLSSSFFFPSCPLSFSRRRQTVSTHELRTLSLVERSGHMPQWYVGTEGVSAGQASWLGRAAVV